MVLGSLTYIIDESYINSLDNVLQEYFWEDDSESDRKAYLDKEGAINQAENDFNTVNKILNRGGNLDDSIYKENREYFDRVKNKINRIYQRSRMYSKNKLDRILLKLKKFAHKLELSPLKKKNANFFQKLKSLIGTVIRKLTNILMKKLGTQNRKGKVTDADKVFSWSAPNKEAIKDKDIEWMSWYSPSELRD